MRRSGVNSAAAAFLLLFTLADLSFPAMCSEDSQPVAANVLTSSHGVFSAATGEHNTNTTTTDDDCFCCSSPARRSFFRR